MKHMINLILKFIQILKTEGLPIALISAFDYLIILFYIRPLLRIDYGKSLFVYTHRIIPTLDQICLHRRDELVMITNIGCDDSFYFPSDVDLMDMYNVSRGYGLRMSRKYTYQEFIDIDSSDTVVDVGAYVGGFTTVAATQAREVIACEPAPQTAQALRENVASLENVRVVQKAVYNDFGTFQLNLSEDPTDNSLIKVDSSPLDVTETVETTTIDRLVESLNIEVIDFLKLDGEGVEPEVVKGIKNSEIKKIAVDAGRERFGQESIEEVRSLLISNGFEVRVDSHMIFARQK